MEKMWNSFVKRAEPCVLVAGGRQVADDACGGVAKGNAIAAEARWNISAGKCFYRVFTRQAVFGFGKGLAPANPF